MRRLDVARVPERREPGPALGSADSWWSMQGEPRSVWRIGSLLVLGVALASGVWKAHPLLSLTLPGIAVVPWLRAVRARRVESWLLCYACGTYIYAVLRALADDAGLALRSGYVIAADRVLFGGAIPTEFLQDALFTPYDADWIDWLATALHASFFIAPHAALAYVWLRHPSALPIYVGSILLTLYLALVACFLWPTMPPWLAVHTEEMAGTYRVINFVLGRVDADTYQAAYDRLAEPNAVASMPSVHMAITWILVLAARDLARRLFWPLVGYASAMAISLVYLGEHYVLDVLVGIAVANVAYLTVRRYGRYERPAAAARPGVAVPALARTSESSATAAYRRE